MYQFSKTHYILLVVISICLFITFQDSLLIMERWWRTREEYSHGYLLPIVSAYFVWLKKHELARLEFKGSWAGVLLVIFGLFTGYIGIKSTLNNVQQYAFLLTFYGVVLSIIGPRASMKIWAPLLLLLFMVPLPNFIYNNLSQKLQLLSSFIGVEFIRVCNISVYLEGNVIDLGSFQLQVVDACSGLRYLFPLMSFGFICAYLFKAPLWQRFIVFITTIPITVLMNSFRIGMIGLLVNFWGIEQAEGFLHDFEGWFIFMACVAILFLEMWLLTFLTKDKPGLFEVFGLEMPAEISGKQDLQERSVNKQSWLLVPLMILAALVFIQIGTKPLDIPEREQFVSFPDEIDPWQGRRSKLDQIYIDGLRGMTDYILTDYSDNAGNRINFYSAYYDAQSSGSSIHSPASCLPGGGWKIHSMQETVLQDVMLGEKPLSVNRALIQQGDSKQLVYYWFQQRGHNMTNEYIVKWQLLLDSIRRNRTDGALIRITTAVRPGQDIDDAETTLKAFTRAILPELSDFIPD